MDKDLEPVRHIAKSPGHKPQDPVPHPKGAVADLNCPSVGLTQWHRQAGIRPSSLAPSQPQQTLWQPNTAETQEQALQAKPCLVVWFHLENHSILFMHPTTRTLSPAGVGLCWLLLCWWCPTAPEGFTAVAVPRLCRRADYSHLSAPLLSRL